MKIRWKRVTGLAMLFIPFLAVFFGMVLAIGIKDSLVVVACIVGLVGWIWVAVALMNSGRRF